MATIVDGTAGVTFPAGGVGNPAGAVVGTTDTQTLTNKTLSATGITTVAAGTAALPAIVSTTGTADTGLWFPAADTVAASTAGTERMRIDSSGNVLVTNVAGLGYGTGAGGSVTQATSKATAVTLNKPCGTITLAADALASNTTARFSFNNSILAITDTVILIIRNGVTAGAYLVWVDGTAAGSCTLAIRNISAGSLSDAVALNFSIIKGVTA